MRTGGERTMLQMIDTTNHVGSLLRGKAFDWIFLGKRPKRIARLNANGLVGNIGNGLGIRGVTSAKTDVARTKKSVSATATATIVGTFRATRAGATTAC